MRFNSFHPLTAVLAAAVLVACGGGGSSPPTVTFPTDTRSGVASAGADMTVANFPTLSADAVEALLSTIGGGDALSQPLGTGRARAASLGRFAATQGASHIAAGSRARAMAVANQTFQCSNYTGTSGYFTVTANDADNNNVLSAGDSATISFVNCISPAGSPAIDGSFMMVFNVLVLDAQQQPSAFDASVTMSALTVQGLGSLDGLVHLWVAPVAGGERSFERYVDMVSRTSTASGEKVAVLNFDVDQTAGTTTVGRLNGSVQLGSDIYVITQISAFDTTTGDPASGQLRVTDVQGDRLVITARGTVVDREFFVVTNNTATPDTAILGTPWASFKQ
jgi:hypothetical protein